MRFRYVPGVLFTAGILLLLVVSVWLWTAQPASAQCGSQASSCKNCHEVQGQKPVNSDGTAWHASHAFGDFCYICHAGNNQAKDIDGAHAGMVPPLSDIKASCQQCHPGDLQERAQVYATALGVEIGAGAPSAPGNSPVGNAPTPNEQAAAVVPVIAPASMEIDVDDPNVDIVNYVERYNEIVLGQRPVNKGNTLLMVMIGMVAVGGSGFVFYNETQARKPARRTEKVHGEYPVDVVEMLPAIAGLQPHSREWLRTILENPQKAETVLKLIDILVSDAQPGNNRDEKNH